MPGFSRKKWGRWFSCFDARSRRIRDDAVLTRIKGLVIPPAWTEVWICPLSQGHIQATGRDADGRLQSLASSSPAGGVEKQTARAVRQVAEALGNTVAVCRQYYIHPAVMGALDTDGLEKAFGWVDRHRAGVRVQALGRAERAVLRFLTTREKR